MMKLWVEKSYWYPPEDCSHLKAGFGWYRHSRNHPYKGFTFDLFFFKWWIIVTWVSDFAAYEGVMNRWRRARRKISDRPTSP